MNYARKYTQQQQHAIVCVHQLCQYTCINVRQFYDRKRSLSAITQLPRTKDCLHSAIATAIYLPQERGCMGFQVIVTVASSIQTFMYKLE